MSPYENIEKILVFQIFEVPLHIVERLLEL